MNTSHHQDGNSPMSIAKLMDDFFRICGTPADKVSLDGMLDDNLPFDEVSAIELHKAAQMQLYNRFMAALCHALRQAIPQNFERELRKARAIADILIKNEEVAGHSSHIRVANLEMRIETVIHYCREEARSLHIWNRPECAQRSLARKANDVCAFRPWLPVTSEKK